MVPNKLRPPPTTGGFGVLLLVQKSLTLEAVAFWLPVAQ